MEVKILKQRGQGCKQKRLNFLIKEFNQIIHMMLSNEIVHLDLKPQNIIWNKAPGQPQKLVVIDWENALCTGFDEFKMPESKGFFVRRGAPGYISDNLINIALKNSSMTGFTQK